MGAEVLKNKSYASEMHHVFHQNMLSNAVAVASVVVYTVLCML